LIPDHEAAAADWYKKYGCTQINHMFVVNSELAKTAGCDRGTLPDAR
jgi:hypothetical protein